VRIVSIFLSEENKMAELRASLRGPANNGSDLPFDFAAAAAAVARQPRLIELPFVIVSFEQEVLSFS